MSLAPIVLFVYNRPEHTAKTLQALSNCFLADQSELFIFADGQKKNATLFDIEQINETRRIIKQQKCCKNVEIFESETNKGLSRNILEGVTKIINQYGKVIVLEDDLIVGKYFLTFLNDSLDRYQDYPQVFHITGYRYPVNSINDNESFFYPIMDCWGWATWADRWAKYEKNGIKLKKTFTDKMKKEFNADGCCPNNWLQVVLNANGDLNTWAIFWYATIFLNNGLCLAPCVSQVINNGIDSFGTNINTIDKKLISNKCGCVKIDLFPVEIQVNEIEYKKNKQYMKSLKSNNKVLVFAKQLLSNLGLFGLVKKLKKKLKVKK